MKRYLAVILLLFPLAGSTQQAVDHWETIVTSTQQWRYRVPSFPVSGWENNGFNDSFWSQGQASIGYGDGDDITTVSTGTICVYMRATFTVLDTSKIEAAFFHVDYDDGFVAYLNGTEIARSNMTGTPAYNSTASAQHEAVMYTGGTPEAYSISKSTLSALLVNGTNVLAIEAHNQNSGSSDLTGIGFFSVGIDDTNTYYNPTPSWFVAPTVFTSSNIPIVVINTNSQTILDDPRIVCDMGIIDNGPGIRNYLNDPYNNYNGKISIEIRGSSSQMFPKKSYALETQDSIGNPLNASLMGMPAENDWVLYAPYTDKSFMRDVLAYKLGNDQGHWAPRTRFCELVINGEYLGIYVMLEKIKVDNNRLNIANLTTVDTTGDELTGGYILKVDRYDSPVDHFTSSFNTIPNNTQINYVYDDPEEQDLLPVQEQYIQDYVYDFEYAAFQPTFADTAVGYPKYADMNSFVDYFIVNEVSRNVDGYRLSAFVYKDKESNGGKLMAGPLWDYNLGYGNADYCNGGNTTGYALDFNTDCPGDGWQIPFWWYQMTNDTNFVNRVRCRYDELRANVLSDAYMVNYIDSVATVLDESQIRNYEKWPILGTYVWPNNYIGATFTDEINYLKAWLTLRLSWLDDNLPGNCWPVVPSSVNEIQEEFLLSVYPNPARESVFISLSGNNDIKREIVISDITGKQILSKVFSSRQLQLDVQPLSPGMYFISVVEEGRIKGVVKFQKM